MNRTVFAFSTEKKLTTRHTMDEKRALVEEHFSPNHAPGAVASCGQQDQLMHPVQPVVQQPIMLQVSTPMKPPKIISNYKSELSRRFGIAQLLLGSVAIIMNTVGIIIHATGEYMYVDERNPGSYHYSRPNDMYFSGAGIWCPLCFFSLSGAFSLAAARMKTRCMIVTNLVLCIVSSVFSGVMLVFAFLVFGRDIYMINLGFEYTGRSSMNYELVGTNSPYDAMPNYCSAAAWRYKTSMVLSTVWVLVGVAEFIVCVLTATLCCRVLCCAASTNNTEPAMSARYTVNAAGSVQPQLLVLDSQGRPITGAQVIQIPGPSGVQHIQTCQGGQPQATAVQGDPHVKQGPDPVLPPPYQA